MEKIKNKQAKTALVTGATSRVGKAIARKLIDEYGFDVIIHGRYYDALNETADEIDAINLVEGDLFDNSAFEDIEDVVERQFSEEGLGLVVHSASTFFTDKHGMMFDQAESSLWPKRLSDQLEDLLLLGNGTSLALTDNSVSEYWENFVGHGAMKSAIESTFRSMSAREQGKPRGESRIRYVTVRLPTILPPDNHENIDDLIRKYGPIGDFDMAISQICNIGTILSHLLGNHSLKVGA